MSTKTVSVRLPEDLHRAVKVRCAERGDSLEGVARAAFVAYLERDPSEPGSVLERAGVRPGGLDAGVARAGSSPEVPAAAPASSQRSFRPDPKKGK